LTRFNFDRLDLFHFFDEPFNHVLQLKFASISGFSATDERERIAVFLDAEKS
jgi:hypothetical protein